jgi:hypothetical protein
VDHHRNFIHPVVTWLFWLKGHAQLSKNRQLDSHPAGDRDHSGHIKPVKYHLALRFIKKDRKDNQAGCLSDPGSKSLIFFGQFC